MRPYVPLGGGRRGGGRHLLDIGVRRTFVTVVWIVFPFIVHSHFQEMKRLQRETNSYLKRMTEEVAAANVGKQPQPAVKSPPPPTASLPNKGDDVYRL